MRGKARTYVAVPVLHDAACKGEEPELWQAIDARERQFRPEARNLCRTCPAQEACLRWALETDERYGIWGGLTPGERGRLKRSRA